MLAALVEIRVRELEKCSKDVGICHSLAGQMAVRIELGSDQDVGSDDGTDTLEQVTLAVVIALRHHGAMQPENDAIDRHRRLELIEDFVAQTLIGLPLQQPARLRPGRGSLDQRRSLPPSPGAATPPSAQSTTSASPGARRGAHRRPFQSWRGLSAPGRTCWFLSRAMR